MGRVDRRQNSPPLPLLMTCVRVMVQNWLFIALSLPRVLPVSAFPGLALRVFTYWKANEQRGDVMAFPCSKHCSAGG